MSWHQWSGASAPQPPPVVATAAPIINPAPNVIPPGLPYNTDQWSQMQQQNWQQWAQWQQQYQQWHQQYGAEYQKSMNALAAQQAVVPNVGVPPPLPAETQPPLPKEDGPKPPPLPTTVNTSQQPPVPQYSTQVPPPTNQFSAPPPNFTPNVLPQDWKGGDGGSVDHKRPLDIAEDSQNKRQMLNKPGWKSSNNASQHWQAPTTPNPEELSEAEKKFDKQFAEWEAQFNKWKEQNSGHPDKQQYREYEKKWEQWRQQLLDRREAMRKKRLGLTMNKAPITQNFSVPPPTQAPLVVNTQAPPPPLTQSTVPPKPNILAPVNPSVSKEALLPTPTIFAKPPPDMNNEPLQFKGIEEQKSEPSEGNLGFLSSSKSEGIPGLDLVKDGDSEDHNENDEPVVQKGPDLEAISKGINNILGDQKLMSMLSMVSQNHNANQNTNVDTTSRITDMYPQHDQSNLSVEDSRNEPMIQSEVVQNFDDQTRSSFTMQPSDADFYRGGPPVNQLNRGFQENFDKEPPFSGISQTNRFPNKSFGGPLKTNRYDRETESGIGGYGLNRDSLLKNPNDFDRNISSNLGKDTFCSRGPGMPQMPMRRDSLGPPNRESFRPDGAAKPPFMNSGNMNREDFLSRDVMSKPPPPIPQGNATRESFGFMGMGKPPPPLPQGGITREAVRPLINKESFGDLAPGPFNRDKFEPGMKRDNFGPRDNFASRDNFGPRDSGRDKFGEFNVPLGDKSRFGPSGRGFLGRNNLEFGNREPYENNPPLDRGRLEFERDNLGGRSYEDKFQSNFDDQTNSQEEDLNYDRDDYQGTFQRNQRFADGPRGRKDDISVGPHNFGPQNMRANDGYRNDPVSAGRHNFNQRDGPGRFELYSGDRPPFNKSNLDTELGRFDNRGMPPLGRISNKNPNFDERGPGFREGRHLRDNFGPDTFGEEDDYPPPPSLLGQPNRNDDRYVSGPRMSSLGNNLLDAPDPPEFSKGVGRFDGDHYDEELPRDGFDADDNLNEPIIEEMWKPAKVFDYDHKPPNSPEMDIIVQPFRMFDYRHKPLRRIPFPDRPNWLSDSVRMIPEFDPPIIRAPIDRRLYEDRFEPPRRDDRYDIPRKDDRLRFERGYELKFSPPPHRRDDDDLSWSTRRNRSRSPPKFERHSFEVDRDNKRHLSRDKDTDREVKEGNWRNRKGWEDEKVDWKRKDDFRERGKDDYKERNKDDIRDRRKDDFRGRGRDDFRDRERDDFRDRGKDDFRERGKDDFRERGNDWKSRENIKSKDSDWEERARQWEEDDDMDVDGRDRSRDRGARFQDRNTSSDKDHFSRKPGDTIFPVPKPMETENLTNVTPIGDLLNSPGRHSRPPRIVIILRGPPGSGKTHLAKIIKDKEVENGGSAPRILSLDDYFMVEQEKEVLEDGKKIKIKDMVYEFEAEMEDSYRTSLMRSFKKTVTDGYFPFIIVDNVNDKVKYFGEMWSFAKQNGFQVYICELDLDVQNCVKRNIHNRTEEEIRKVVNGWEKTPSHHPILDASLLLQDEPIREVEMEEIDSPGEATDNGEGLEDQLDRSKWDNFDCSLNNLARLDGVNKPLRTSRTMEEYLQLDDEWTPNKPTKPGQKRVRWADLEERKEQEKMRAIGFVVGQTNWDRMMDPTMGESALTQTKYIDRVERRRF